MKMRVKNLLPCCSPDVRTKIESLNIWVILEYRRATLQRELV